ncbi:MAG: ABC transporter ATP-binding protein [Ignavibacteriae bacterium]|nr:ABC transporter ATP-binding protein [Ignavibacteriota bacterium]
MRIDLKSFKSDFSNISKTMKFVFESDKKLSYASLVLLVIMGALPLIVLYLTKVLIDSITNSGGYVQNDVWYVIAIFCSVILFMQIAISINSVVYQILGHRVVNYVNNLLHNKSLELDLTYYDNAEYHDTFHRAQQEATSRPLQIVGSVSELIKSIISFVGVAAILASLSIYILLIMILAGIPALVIKFRRTKLFFDWKMKNTSLYRKVNYFSNLMTSRLFAKETRIFRLGKHIQHTHDETRENLLKSVIKFLKIETSGNIISSLFEVAALSLAIIFLTYKYNAGEVTIGGFVMFLGAVRSANTYLSGIMTNLTGIYSNKLFLSTLFDFIKLEPQIKQIENPIPFPKLKKGIKVENITFRYENGLKTVLKDVSFSVKPGETVLITGKNGAGKTTFINLLCRMYECTSGTITFDDINIKDLDIESFHKNIGIIYQDYCKYDLTVRENIMYGAIDKKNSVEKVADLSGASQFVEEYPLKYETVVGKHFKDGEELSIGQWQKIALARAFYSDAQIIILDEPTSSIDLLTENNFFENLQNHVKDKIVIIIGHKITHKIKADSYYTLHKGVLKEVSEQFLNA